MSHPKYNNTMLKENIWKGIAKEMKQSGKMKIIYTLVLKNKLCVLKGLLYFALFFPYVHVTVYICFRFPFFSPHEQLLRVLRCFIINYDIRHNDLRIRKHIIFWNIQFIFFKNFA